MVAVMRCAVMVKATEGATDWGLPMVTYSVCLSMPRYSRVAISLPKSELDSADRLARAQDRPRSWIIAEAIRHYASSYNKARVERATAPASPGLGESRLAQLRRDLALTPEARVRAAEETLKLSERVRRPKAQHVIAFDRYQDFVDWKRMQDRLV